MNYAVLIEAIMAVESGGRDQAIGDGGRALGPLQIHRAVVQDVNRFAGTSYRWEGMTNRADARAVCETYLRHYGKGKTMEETARIWNGGPKANTKARRHLTDAYWVKVKGSL